MERESFLTISKGIRREIEKNPQDLSCYSDLLDACKAYGGAETAETCGFLLDKIVLAMRAGYASELYPVYKRALLFHAPVSFDSYMQYLEINRKAEERFYLPRRRRLKPLVDAMQELADDKLDELFLSMPPRVGKTTVLMFFVTWIIGRDPEASNLYCAYSDIITKAFYNGVLEVLNDDFTYTWHEVFPGKRIVSTNSQEETLNIDRRKRYPSLTARSLYGTLNGACDCNGILISDDLIGGIEEALNRDRLIAAWSKVDNNMLPRAKEKAKILWCGTRWSNIDPAGLRMGLLTDDLRFANRRVKIINVPALDENDESNFDYLYGVGFSTEYYKQRRASFEKTGDLPSWAAQYMGEPIEREGTLFAPDELKYFNGTLPETKPDYVYMAVDPAFGGGDYVAAPVCLQYGEDIYIPAVVFSDGDKTITQPLVANTAIRWNVVRMQIEANKAVEWYKEGVAAFIRNKGKRISIVSKAAPNNKSKEARIFDVAPDIKERMIFLDSANRSKEYEKFMQNVYSFKITGNNKHDDAPDSLAMAISMVIRPSARAEVFKRKF